MRKPAHRVPMDQSVVIDDRAFERLSDDALDHVAGGLVGAAVASPQNASYSLKDALKPQRFDADYSADGNDV